MTDEEMMANRLSLLDTLVLDALTERLEKLEKVLDADVISIFSPMTYGVDTRLNRALMSNPKRKEKLAIILETPGGVAEIVERMVESIRNVYEELIFIVPDRAMSAGTIFVMAGDRILMSPFSVLGPIDPQIEKDGKLIPALSYLNQYEALVEKSSQGKLTTAEFAMLDKLDLAELHTFRQARDLSVDLVKKWLADHKFKDWTETETQKQPVTAELRQARAKEIADALTDNERWHSHARGISMSTLRKELNLRVENYQETKPLAEAIHAYFDLYADMLNQKSILSFVHSRYYY